MVKFFDKFLEEIERSIIFLKPYPGYELIINRLLNPVDHVDFEHLRRLRLLFEPYEWKEEYNTELFTDVLKRIIPENFCVFAFRTLQLDPDGSARPCCKYNVGLNQWHDVSIATPKYSIDELFNQPYFTELRDGFLKNEKRKSCHACWSEEKAGIPSMRLDYEDGGKRSPWETVLIHMRGESPLILDLKLSSICNLKCRICSSYLSSKWLAENVELGIIDQNTLKSHSRNAKEKFTHNPKNMEILTTWAPHLKQLQFYGGEPLLQTEHNEILKLLVDGGFSKNIDLQYNTNTTICNDEIFELWRNFKKVTVSLSIDDIGPRLEYQRHPIKWIDAQTNITRMVEMAKDSNLELTLYCTVGILNVLYLDELLKFNSETFKLPVFLNMVHFPPEFNIANLPLAVKTRANTALDGCLKYNEYLTSVSIENVKSFMNVEPDLAMIPKLLTRLKQHDQYRKEDFQTTFPELAELIHGSIN